MVLDSESQGEAILGGGWCSGRNERTAERGDFPSEVVYIIPAMSKPPPDILVSPISALNARLKKRGNRNASGDYVTTTGSAPRGL